MKEPIRHRPLTVLDSQTVKREDTLRTNLFGVTKPGPARITMLKYNPDHRFYYYPLMQPDEVLVFKQYVLHPGIDDK